MKNVLRVIECMWCVYVLVCLFVCVVWEGACERKNEKVSEKEGERERERERYVEIDRESESEKERESEREK